MNKKENYLIFLPLLIAIIGKILISDNAFTAENWLNTLLACSTILACIQICSGIKRTNTSKENIRKTMYLDDNVKDLPTFFEHRLQRLSSIYKRFYKIRAALEYVKDSEDELTYTDPDELDAPKRQMQYELQNLSVNIMENSECLLSLIDEKKNMMSTEMDESILTWMDQIVVMTMYYDILHDRCLAQNLVSK